MRRFLAILTGTLILLAGALTASATTRQPVHPPAPAAATGYQMPAIHLSSLQLANRAAAQEMALQAAAAHTAHLAHLARMQHHLAHLAHLATIVTDKAMQARLPAAHATSVISRAPVTITQAGDGDHDSDDPAWHTVAHSYAAPVVHRSSARPAYAVPQRTGGLSTSSSGTYSYAGLEQLWISAGGPAWAAAHAASIAECESGGRTNAYNPSGATGVWQILGSVVGGNLRNAYDNARNAVAKFNASGGNFAQWVCK